MYTEGKCSINASFHLRETSLSMAEVPLSIMNRADAV
jgi:hypothetical protein